MGYCSRQYRGSTSKNPTVHQAIIAAQLVGPLVNLAYPFCNVSEIPPFSSCQQHGVETTGLATVVGEISLKALPEFCAPST